MEGEDWIPPKVRAWVYRLLALAFGLEAIFNWIDAGAEAKIVAVLSLLGFSMAAVHTPTKGY